jgi:hypothetical protein
VKGAGISPLWLDAMLYVDDLVDRQYMLYHDRYYC